MKSPAFAPASTAIFARVNLSDIGMFSIVSPQNSSALYVAPSAPIIPIRWSIKSFEQIPFLNLPLTSILNVAGTLSHVLPSAIATAISVDPIPVANAPRAPDVQV